MKSRYKVKKIAVMSSVVSSLLIPVEVYSEGVKLEEIVITARKREESLQDVPVAVSAVTGNTIQNYGIKNAEDLFSITPGLYFSQAGQRNNEEQFYLVIRGVGSSPVAEPSVGVFVDGVYMPSLGWSMDFLDVERVEVLRGPQGALFGRNTQAGALSIITKKPTDRFEGSLTGEISEFDSYKVGGSISAGLTDSVSFSIGGFGSTTDGYVDNITRGESQNDKDKHGGRLMLAYRADNESEIIFSADYTSSDGHFNAFGDAAENLGYRVVDPTATAMGNFIESHDLAGREYTTYGDHEQTFDTENSGFSLTVNYSLGEIDLVSITGYREVSASDSFDIDGTTLGDATNTARTEQEILSEELRFSGAIGDSVDWTLGVYLFEESLDQRRFSDLRSGVLAAALSPGFVSDNVSIDREGYAVFGHVNYDVTDSLKLSVGARFSKEKVEQEPSLNVDVTVPTPGGPVNINFINDIARDNEFSGFSPAASLSYFWNSDVMTYLSVATGFKGGGFTKEVPNTPEQNIGVDNETSLTYELGIKAQLLDNRMLLNADYFFTTIDDQQLSTRTEVAPGVFAPATVNAGESEIKGVEIELSAMPIDKLTFRGSFTYTDAEFTEYVAAPGYDRAGQKLPEVPEIMASMTIDYRIALPNDTDIVPSLTWRYIDDKFIGDGNSAIPFIDIPSYDVVDLQVKVEDESWDLTFYAKNVTDEYYFVNSFLSQPVLSVPDNRAYYKPGAPRQVGVRLSYRF